MLGKGLYCHAANGLFYLFSESMNDKIEILIAFLSQYITLDEQEVKAIDEVVKSRQFKRKEIFFKEGDTHKYLAFILSGAVRFFYVDEEGQEQTIEIVLEHNPIGEYKGVVAKTTSKVFVEAIEDIELLGINRDDLMKLLDQNPKYYQLICELSSQALKDVENRNKLLRISSSKKRYEELARLRPKIIERVPLTYIASYLNMALGTLSRVRAGKL